MSVSFQWSLLGDGVALEEHRPVVYFDMDGTIANLYAVDRWCEKLDSGDASPYLEAQPMMNAHLAAEFIDALHSIGWCAGILSWLSKGADDDFNERVVDAKLSWLEDNFPDTDEIIIVEHGISKPDSVVPAEAVLIDDEAQNRLLWDASGPFRRSYPASEIGNLTNVLSMSLAQPPSYERVGWDVERLVDEMERRFEEGIGDIPEIKLVEDDGRYALSVANAKGSSFHQFYREYVWLYDLDQIDPFEVDCALAKADRMVYDLSR